MHTQTTPITTTTERITQLTARSDNGSLAYGFTKSSSTTADMELRQVDKELSAAENTPAMNKPDSPGSSPKVSITKSGSIWSTSKKQSNKLSIRATRIFELNLWLSPVLLLMGHSFCKSHTWEGHYMNKASLRQSRRIQKSRRLAFLPSDLATRDIVESCSAKQHSFAPNKTRRQSADSTMCVERVGWNQGWNKNLSKWAFQENLDLSHWGFQSVGSVGVFHDNINSAAFKVDSSFYSYEDQSEEHRKGLNNVCPHHSFQTALKSKKD